MNRRNFLKLGALFSAAMVVETNPILKAAAKSISHDPNKVVMYMIKKIETGEIYIKAKFGMALDRTPLNIDIWDANSFKVLDIINAENGEASRKYFWDLYGTAKYPHRSLQMLLYRKASKIMRENNPDINSKSIHSSISQGKKGKKGGAIRAKQFTPEYIENQTKILREHTTTETCKKGGRNSRIKLNTDIATCTKCGFTGGKNAMRKWHSIPGGPDKCEKPRKYTEKEATAHLIFAKNGIPNLLESNRIRKAEFQNREQLIFDNLPNVFRKKEALEISNEIGIKLNYNYLRNTANYEKIGFGIWRKTTK